MQFLLDKLTKPEIKPDGTIFQPNVWMLKAAEVLKQVSEMWNIDKNGFISAQTNYDLALAENIRLKTMLEPLDLTEYQEAMNKDRE